MKERYTGYVINTVDYKESDSIVSVLCNDGIVSFRARGVKKINSKNASSIMNFALSEFEVSKSEKSGYLTLSDSRLINYPSFISNNLEYIALVNLVSEGIEIINDKDSFECFVNCLDCMKKGINAKLILVSFINYFLLKQGCLLNADECVCCKSKEKIVKFSFENGGYLCKNCCNTYFDDIDYLKKMRILSKVNFDNISKVDMDEKYYCTYIDETINLIENKIGIYFKSKNFLFKVVMK